MPFVNLYELFVNLAPSPASGILNARCVPGKTRDFLAKGAAGQPIFLLAVSTSTGYRPSIALKYISVEFSVTCRVRYDAEEVEGFFVVISCSSDSPDLFEPFVNTCGSNIQTLPNDPTLEDVEQNVRQLIDLFSRLGKVGSRQIKGLWSELLLIANSSSPAILVEAWHQGAGELFDFSNGNNKIEIKSTEAKLRVHEFSADQIIASPNQKIYVVSILLRRSGDGVGVVKLAERICERLEKRPDLASKVWGLVIETLGDEFSEQLDIKFDETYSLESIRVYRAAEIPQVPRPTSSAVFNIRFSANVSDVAPIYDLGRDSLDVLLVGGGERSKDC